MNQEHAKSHTIDGDDDGSRRDTYMLERDFSSSIRLTHQHFLWKDQLGWNMHPEITAVAESRPLAIADVACGNGIWIMEESLKHPSSTFFGFDISDALFPTPDTVPRNVSFSILDAHGPIPKELCERFDVVHCRLLICAIQDGDVRPFLKTFLSLLRPGGYLQWGEVSKTEPVGESAGTDAMWHGFGDGISNNRPDLNAKFTWVKDLPATFREHGLTNVKAAEGGKSKQHMGRFWTDNHLGAVAEVAKGIGTGDKVIQDIDEARRHGINMSCEIQVVLGQK